MIDPKTIELMNRVLDGAATEPERAELDRAVTSSPEVRAHFDALSRMVQRLDAVPMVEPPTTLHPRIVDALDASPPHATKRAGGDGGFVWWIRNLLPTPALRYGSTFGLGIAAGAVAIAMLRPGVSVDPNQVAGTMASPPSGNPAAAGVLPVSAPQAGISAAVAVLDRGDSRELRLLVHGQEPTEWVFRIPESRDETPQPVVLKVHKAGQTVFEGTVQPVVP